MGGTTFLDALKKKSDLKKGYPLGSGEVVPEEGTSLRTMTVGHGTESYPNPNALYKTPSLLRRVTNRLMAPTKDPVGVTPQYESVRDRLEMEQSEGLERNKPQVTKAGLPNPNKKKEDQ